MKLLLIALGGALGSVTRHLLDAWVQRLSASSFPYGTLVVNATGCFGIGLALTVLEARGLLDTTLRLTLTAGLLGGFTTYSSFNQQALELARARGWGVATLHLGTTVALCLLTGAAGMGAGRLLGAPR